LSECSCRITHEKDQNLKEGYSTQKDDYDRLLKTTLRTLDRSLRTAMMTQVPGDRDNNSIGKELPGRGLTDVKSEELILFPGNKLGIAFNLDAQEVAAVILDSTDT